MRTRLSVVAVIALSLLLIISGCGPAKPEGESSLPEKTDEAKRIKVGFSQMDHSGPWRVAQTTDMEEVAAARGFDLVYTDAQEELSKQLSDIEDLVAQRVDYLVIAPRESTGLERGLEVAKEAGIPVILIDRDHEGKAGEDYVTLIASDFIFQGFTCGEALAKAMAEKGNVAVIEGQPGGSDARDRQQGFEDAIENYPDIKIIAQQPGDYSRSKAQSVMENFLQAHGKDINAVYCHDDEMALGVITAIEAYDLEPGKDVMVSGIDGQKAAIQAIIDGKMTIIVTCSPLFGEPVFDTIARHMAGETIEGYIQMKDYVITAENAAEEIERGF